MDAGSDAILDRHYDRKNPYSLINLVPKSFQEAMDGLDTKYMDSSERILRENLKPDDIDYCLRINFWKEFNLTMRTPHPDTKMVMSRVWENVCSYGTFQRKLKNELWLGWLLKPLRNYEQNMENLLYKMLERYDELVDMDITKHRVDCRGQPVYDKQGKAILEIDPKKAKVLLSVMQNIENRAKGMAVQRIDTKTEHAIKLPEQHDARILDERIRLLQEKVGSTPTDVIDAQVAEELSEIEEGDEEDV